MENQIPDPREALWRRKLSEAERAELQGRPELELEARLTEALARISDAPVPSNFAARVMDAVEFEEARLARSAKAPAWHWNWRLLLPRAAVTAAILLFAGVGLERYEANLQRAEIARTLSMVVSSKAVPSLDALNNFDAIQRMSQSGRADTDLLAALQ